MVVKYIKYNGNTEAIYYIGLSNDLNSYFVVQRRKKMYERTNVCVNIWFICLDIHSAHLHLVSPFEIVNIWFHLRRDWTDSNGFATAGLRQPPLISLFFWKKKPQYGFFMRNSFLFSPILFSPAIFKMWLWVCNADLTVACFAWEIYWFGFWIHDVFLFVWGHTATMWNRCDIKRIDSSSYYMRLDWYLMCVWQIDRTHFKRF